MSDPAPSAIGLFAGIGGIELGLEKAGFETQGLCEIDPAATAVLAERFPGKHLWSDVRSIERLPKTDVLSAGFPCQDLSQAGKKAGITGSQSSLVGEVFRLCESPSTQPEWLVLENVSYMLRLDKGRAMTTLISALEERGFQWAYRVVDARAFGIPQRRQRVLLVASRRHDVREVLFADDFNGPDYDDSIGNVDTSATYGFYWTEGLRGLGWARNAVPTVKGGSQIGIPSPPAVWLPREQFFGTPEIEDAERLQGFPADWTQPALKTARKAGARWRLVGNAVCVPMAEWLGNRLQEPGPVIGASRPLWGTQRWPLAAWGSKGEAYEVDVTMRPHGLDFDLRKFLEMPLHRLSTRAAEGFLKRARRGRLRFADGFLDELQQYLQAAIAGDQHEQMSLLPD